MAEKTKTDELLEKTLEHLGKMDARLDAMEEERKADKARKDAEETEKKAAEDKAKKDAEEAEEKRKADEARKADDADARKRFDRKDGESEEDAKKRHDAEEEKLSGEFEKKGEAKEVAADRAKRARKDADEQWMADRKKKDEEEEKKKADAAASLAGTTAEEVIAMKAKLKELEALVPRAVTDQDYGLLLQAQARADEAYSQHGLQAPRALNGETVVAYRKRLLRGLQAHSARWKDTDVLKLDDATFGVVEQQVYADSIAAAANPVDLQPGQLRAITRTLPTGHTETTYRGSPAAWMNRFAGPVKQGVKKFLTNSAA